MRRGGGRNLTGADGAEGGGRGCGRRTEDGPEVAAVDGPEEGEARETPQEEAPSVALRLLQRQPEEAVHRRPDRRWRREAGAAGGRPAAGGGLAREEAGLLVFGHSCNPRLHCRLSSPSPTSLFRVYCLYSLCSGAFDFLLTLKRNFSKHKSLFNFDMMKQFVLIFIQNNYSYRHKTS